MLKVGRGERNIMGRVLAGIMAEAKAEGKVASLINTTGITAKSIIALESADDSARASADTALRGAKSSVQQLFKTHFALAMESEDGENH